MTRAFGGSPSRTQTTKLLCSGVTDRRRWPLMLRLNVRKTPWMTFNIITPEHGNLQESCLRNTPARLFLRRNPKIRFKRRRRQNRHSEKPTMAIIERLVSKSPQSGFGDVAGRKILLRLKVTSEGLQEIDGGFQAGETVFAGESSLERHQGRDRGGPQSPPAHGWEFQPQRDMAQVRRVWSLQGCSAGEQ